MQSQRTHRLWRATALGCLPAALLWFSLAHVQSAYADTVVNNCTTAGLQTALSGANGMITFNCGVAPVVITVTDNGGLDVLAGKKFTIDGGDKITLDAAHSNRLFDVRVGGALTLTNIILTGGYQDGAHGNLPDLGGAILAEGLSLTLDHVTIRNSMAVGSGGGLEIISGTILVKDSLIEGNQSSSGGGIDNASQLSLVSALTLVNTIVRSNHALTDFGGGLNLNRTVVIDGSQIDNNVAQYGGGINDSGTLTLTNSTVSSNSAYSGGGIYINGGKVALITSTLHANTAVLGGGILNAGVLTLTSSTLSGNSADYGGGIENGSINPGVTLALYDSTLSNNSATNSGGGIVNGAFSAVTMFNSTLSGNSAEAGGGIYNAGQTTAVNVTFDNHVASTGTAHNLYLDLGVLTLTNSIVNNAASYGANCFGGGFPKSVSRGHNLANDTSCGLMTTGDHEGPLVPILLGGLANHGGPTLTQLPHAASAAIDGGDDFVCAAPPISQADQRGVFRPLDGNGDGFAHCDIGGVERQPSDADSVPWLWLPLIRR